MWHMQRPCELHTQVLWYTCNTSTVNYIPSCITLHMCSPPIYMRSSVLLAHVCAGCDTRNYHLYFLSFAIARTNYGHSCWTRFWFWALILIVLQSTLLNGISIRGWHANWSGYLQLFAHLKILKNYRSITVKVFSQAIMWLCA